jgi:hypothetical protein
MRLRLSQLTIDPAEHDEIDLLKVAAMAWWFETGIDHELGPIEVYKQLEAIVPADDVWHVVNGRKRYIAAIIAGKVDIEAVLVP